MRVAVWLLPFALAAVLCGCVGQSSAVDPGVRQEAPAGGGRGFRSEAQFEEHYRKHGHEFGDISRGEYLRLAQQLRDAPEGGPILRMARANGQFSKFDKRHGWFGAFNSDGTIRTFFAPVDGERYFWRQARRYGEEHE